MDQFGGGPRPHSGLFVNYQGLWWTVSAPNLATIGVPLAEQTVRPVFWGPGPTGSTTQQTTLDTGYLKADWTGGQRIEFGNIFEHDGWRIGYIDLRDPRRRILNSPCSRTSTMSPPGPRRATFTWKGTLAAARSRNSACCTTR